MARSGLSGGIRVAAVGLGVLLTAAAAQITIPSPFGGVPFTLTPLAVVLVGAALGSRLGALSQATYVVLGALGFAVFAPSPGLAPGLARLIGPTGGYLLAYPMAACVAGWLAERGWGRRYLTSVGAMVAGMAVIHLGGVCWLAAAYTHSLPAAFFTGSAPFLLPDAGKAVAAAMILPQAWRLLGRS